MSKIDRLQATLALEEGVNKVKGVSATRSAALSKLGVYTIRDLISHYPRRYLDLSSVRSVAASQVGEQCTVVGKIVGIKFKRPRPKLPIVEVALNDGTATMIVTFFNQPWLKDTFKEGQIVVVAGKTEFNYGYKRMANPFYEIQEDFANCDEVIGRIIAIHPANAKITATQIRGIIREALTETSAIYDPLPVQLRVNNSLMSRARALESVHFPTSMFELNEAKRRLVFEELLFLQLHLIQMAMARSCQPGSCAHNIDGVAVKKLHEIIPFDLTSDQEKAVSEILGSLATPRATTRMLLGDVGTGKTIVSAYGLCAAADSSDQAMFLAPTEVLAKQHFDKLSSLLEECGVTCEVLTGSTDKDKRAQIISDFKNGKLQVLIGTHAILENDVQGANVTFVVIDEQQRFGVNQRNALIAKGAAPDVLYLTATPIPRTLALAVFGGLELSYLNARPNDDAKRQTQVLDKDAIGKAYDAAREALSRGEQVFVICPLIGIDSEARASLIIETEEDYVVEEADNTASAIKEAKFLQDKVFADKKVGLLHGRLSSDEKVAVMQSFYDGEIDVLVSTTVIEVGVDVPNATTMIVQDADRFGLAQLHQLRGRVGRGSKDAQVYLVSASPSEQSIARLNKLAESDDGFEISEFDLSLRHEGDLLGQRQSGTSILKLVDITRDREIIELAHNLAKQILASDPQLETPENAALARELRILFQS